MIEEDEVTPPVVAIEPRSGMLVNPPAMPLKQNGHGKAKHYNGRSVQTAGVGVSEPEPGASQGNGKAKGKKK